MDLAWFKYAGFLVAIILPVGITRSGSTPFQTLSYSIDVYRGRLAPTRDPVAFATYVAFFPAGRRPHRAGHAPAPTNRAGPPPVRHGDPDGVAPHLLGGVQEGGHRGHRSALCQRGLRGRRLDRAGDGAGRARLCPADIRGLQRVFGHRHRHGARLFGIRLCSNFRFPYFSRDLGEFWRRWHVSLNTWFRDYLYIPLGGSRLGRPRALLNVAIVFLVSGLWHGADWKFVTWGAIHAAFFVPLFVLGRNRRPEAGWSWRQSPGPSGRSRWSASRGSSSAPTTWPMRWTASPGWAGAGRRPCPSVPSRNGHGSWPSSVSFLAFEWRQFRRGIRWMWRGAWRHPWVEAVLLLAAMVYGTRQAAQEFIYFAF